MNTYPKTIIVSAQSQDKDNLENLAIHRYYAELARQKSIPFREVATTYKGKAENAFVFVDSPSAKEFVFRIMLETAQNHALLLENDRTAYLVNALELTKDTALLQPLGTFKAVTQAEASNAANYVYDEETGEHWMVK